jgi:putative membrane protein
VLLVAGAGYGAVSWLRTRYWIEEDELRVDTGVISRQSRRIRVDRLQGIDIVQPLVARLFGLAELKMDVAGGGAREGSLAFLPLHEAQALRETLLARRDAVRASRSAGERSGAQAGGPAPVPAAPVPERVLARLDLGTLVASLVLSPETVGFVLAGLALGALFATVGELGGMAGVVPVVIGFGVTLFRRLSAYYGFTVAQTSAGLQVRRGLFELNSQTITVARVQGVVVSEPWMWRRFGWARLDVSVAGYSRSESDGRPAASTVMPVAPRPLVLWLARLLLSDSGAPDPELVALTGPPARARWVSPVRRRFLAGGLGDDLLVSQEGILTRRTHVVPHARVQSLRLTQGPWQRRLSLADLWVDSPPGPVRVRARHRDVVEARLLLDRADALARARRSRR